MTDTAGLDAADTMDGGAERLPSFSEQVASQLGGLRGMLESSLSVFAFVIGNIIWSVRPAVAAAVVVALALALFRLTRREPTRHAINGLVGVAIGALVAWRTGDSRTFYLPGIVLSLGYAVAMVVSMVVRRPLVGWIWAVVADKGTNRWHTDSGLRRTFTWLTLLWATIYLGKVVINAGVYFAVGLTEEQRATILGIIRIALGFPPYALLVALTIWAVRRQLQGREQQPAAAAATGPGTG